MAAGQALNEQLQSLTLSPETAFTARLFYDRWVITGLAWWGGVDAE